jgi:hypothetical protein
VIWRKIEDQEERLLRLTADQQRLLWSRFKGLEADAIMIIETSLSDDVKEIANRYVARSRAKHLLTLIQVDW